jgi:hypothetical protein
LDFPIISDLSTRLTELLKIYFYVGGMPDSVNTWIKTHDFIQVRSIQEDFVEGFTAELF